MCIHTTGRKADTYVYYEACGSFALSDYTCNTQIILALYLNRSEFGNRSLYCNRSYCGGKNNP